MVSEKRPSTGCMARCRVNEDCNVCAVQRTVAVCVYWIIHRCCRHYCSINMYQVPRCTTPYCNMGDWDLGGRSCCLIIMAMGMKAVLFSISCQLLKSNWNDHLCSLFPCSSSNDIKVQRVALKLGIWGPCMLPWNCQVSVYAQGCQEVAVISLGQPML